MCKDNDVTYVLNIYILGKVCQSGAILFLLNFACNWQVMDSISKLKDMSFINFKFKQAKRIS